VESGKYTVFPGTLYGYNDFMNYAMKRIFSRLFFTGLFSANAVAEIEIGQEAPAFQLPDQ